MEKVGKEIMGILCELIMWPQQNKAIQNAVHILWGVLCIQQPGQRKLKIAPNINTLRLMENGCHFVDDNFKCIFLNANYWILIKILLKFVPKGLNNNIPLSDSMMVNLPMYTCVMQPQWVKIPGGRLNKKDGLTRYGNSHVKDKTAVTRYGNSHVKDKTS